MTQVPVTLRAAMRYAFTAALVVAWTVSSAAGAADSVSGSASYKSRTRDFAVTFTHIYLVKGLDPADPSSTIRRLILTTKDLASEIAACKTLRCSTDNLGEGMTVDVDAGPRLRYWLVLNERLVQYSGTERPEALTTTKDTATRLAGTLTFDATESGGPKVDVKFDVALTKDFEAQR
jgi:hypothetical protein